MDWIHNYQLFLFDFDGLLVNTEEIHYEAYKMMCQQRGHHLNWDFPTYCSIAHYSSDGLQHRTYESLPKLHAEEPDWNVLYQEKKAAYLELLKRGAVKLMPGAPELLHALEKAHIKRAVVTHSLGELIQAIRKQNPILDTIPHWITREHYSQPKPSPECYKFAIETLAKPNDRVIGFEDTPRGLQALLGTRAEPVLVASIAYPEIPDFVAKGVKHIPSLHDF